jgi:CheY-like chemotaxis protein
MKYRVLIVDDEKRITDTLALILRARGYEAATAYDGLSAIETCSQFVPDLVISDVVMPGMNGIEMAIDIYTKFPRCKILLCSGQAATANMIEEARDQGHHFPLLAKPVHPEQLLNTIAELLAIPDPALCASQQAQNQA